MKLSIIIVNYNHPELIKKCLATIESSRISFPFEILVVDNASEDKPVLSASQQRMVRMVWNKENAGFGTANNQAAKLAQGEWLLFLNTDIEVVENAIEALMMFAESNGHEAIFGGKLLNTDRTAQASCGPFLTLPVLGAMLFLKGETLGITRYSPDQTKEVDWVSGACLLMKKSTFRKIGGFDEAIFMYMDEVDLCYRAKKQGIKVLFYPRAVFVHRGAATSGSRMEPIINIYRGVAYFYKKHANYVQYQVARILLTVKALLVMGVGVVTGSSYLVKTYRKAVSYL